MTIIKINAITVPAGQGDAMAGRFAARAGAVDGFDGFEGFELLRPSDERDTWLVVTRWADEESFEAWRNSQSFADGHKGEGDEAKRPGGGHPGQGHPGSGEGEAKPPIAMQAELWSFDVSVTSKG